MTNYHLTKGGNTMALQHQSKKSVKVSSEDSKSSVSPAGSLQLSAKTSENAMTPAHILQLQRTVGNQAVQRMLAGTSTLQRAEIPEEELQMKADPNAIQRAEIPEEELQMKVDPNKSAQPVQRKGSDNKMPEDVQMKMESAFNADFSNVNIHEGSKATDVGALAYAQGNDIHFAPGQYNPESESGQQLLGHELTHVVQQRKGVVKPTTEANGMAINDDPGLENEADQMGKKAASQPSLSL
ncbi:MAG: hypothetical protein JWM44_2044 [Bacilli bacterium]|nr:hypothetical protein [Bacilli bacterium]